jgi:hypothetical protein
MSRDVRDQEAPGEGLPSGVDAAPYVELSRRFDHPGSHFSPAPPAGLGAAGEALWHSVVGEYALRTDEQALLAELAHCADEVIALREAIGGEYVVAGSKGQPRPNPLVTTLHATRTLMIRLASQLGLPDEDEEPSKATPAGRRAAHAARSRWAGHRQAEAQAEAYRRGEA